MRELVNLNALLENERNKSLYSKTMGPRVFVTGSPQTGKTTICKILVNYSLRLGWTPLFVDIDLSQNMISAPGCMSATLIEEVIHGYSDNFASNSISYFHGASSSGNFIITPEYFET